MRKKKIWIILLGLAMAGLCGLMILVVLFSFRGFGAPNFRTWHLSLDIPGQSASSDETRTFTISTPGKLSINNPYGFVTIKGTNGNQVKIRVQKDAHGFSKENAEENLKKMIVEMEQDGNTISINVPEPSGIVVNYPFVDFTVEVPEDTAVSVDNNTGDLNVNNIASDLMLHSNFGNVDVSDIKDGSISVSSKAGSIKVQQVTSDEHPVELTSDFGSIDLMDARSSQVSVSSNNGEVSFTRVESNGPIILTNEFGEINLRETWGESLDVVSKNGSVNLKETRINNSLTVKNDFGDILLDNVFPQTLNLQNKNGSIVLKQVSGIITASTEFGSIEINNGQDCGLNLSSRNGSITYEGSLGAGPYELTSDFGSISLKLPSDSALTVDLKTEFGDINNAFEITTEGKIKGHHLEGKINGGGAILNIDVKNGSINLEKTDSVRRNHND
ncbi:hypothetical protein hrd7_00410 [Leptolinea sp. HRD-7]|nr:hypothetical protein hrd7_00410 [Leptolinea sp. HRD-7]